MEAPFIKKSFSDELDVISLKAGGIGQHFMTLRLGRAGGLEAIENASRLLDATGACPAAQFILGNRLFASIPIENKINWPVTRLVGDKCLMCTQKCMVGGMQLWAVSGTPVKPVVLNGRVVGRVFEDEHAEYCYLGNVVADHLDADNYTQTVETYENMKKALQQVGMEFHHIARTWVYLHDLLKWYDVFNRARTDFFKANGVFEHMVPASTGIGACLPSPAAIVCGALAVKPKSNAVKVFAVASPMQCPALDYRSSFSRAVEIDTPDYRQLLISGTASIEPGGKTVHLDDIDKQIDLTIQVMDAIIESRGLDWTHCSRAIAYYKEPAYMDRFLEYWRSTQRPYLPLVNIHADVCRDDLLFEIEADYLKAK